MTDRIVDPNDGLVAGEVGIWTLEKHRRLQKYIDISRAVRRKFNNQAGATYIELHCGTGRAFVRETRAFIDGSPLVAFSAAYGGSQFSEMHLADIDDESVSAVQARLKAKGATAIHAYVGEAGNTA